MKNILTVLKRHAKKLSFFAGVSAVAIIGVTAVSAWGPDRPTYTVAHPADHITFNSITDNPIVGDERNFVVIKDAANTNSGGWQDNITAEPGKEYLVRVYVHNNAADNLNLTAVNTRVSASVPTTTGKKVSLSGFVSADNAAPQKVWDDASLNSTKDFNVAYVPGSARIYNNGYAKGGNGQALPDSIVTYAGALVGYNGPDGKVPGCFEYVSYVTFKIKPQFAQTTQYEVQKTVRKSGDSQWQQTVAAKPGDKVDYLIRYANTGDSQQDSVVVVDKLPNGMSLVPNSTFLKNSNHPTNDYKPANQTGIVNGGLSIGNHAAGGVSYVWFSATVPEADKLACGPNVLKNWAYGSPAGQTPSNDDADVTVTKKCEKQPPVFACTALDVIALGNNKYRFNVTTKAENGATVNKYIYNFDDATPELNTDKNVVEHQYKQAGEYNVSVRVVFNVNDEQKDDNCTAKIVIPATPVTPERPTKPQPPVTTIPSTGAGGVVAGIFGTSALAYGVYAWLESRRALKNM